MKIILDHKADNCCICNIMSCHLIVYPWGQNKHICKRCIQEIAGAATEAIENYEKEKEEELNRLKNQRSYLIDLIEMSTTEDEYKRAVEEAENGFDVDQGIGEMNMVVIWIMQRNMITQRMSELRESTFTT